MGPMQVWSTTHQQLWVSDLPPDVSFTDRASCPQRVPLMMMRPVASKTQFTMVIRHIHELWTCDGPRLVWVTGTDRSFAVEGPRVWNMLATSLHLVDNFTHYTSECWWQTCLIDAVACNNGFYLGTLYNLRFTSLVTYLRVVCTIQSSYEEAVQVTHVAHLEFL